MPSDRTSRARGVGRGHPAGEPAAREGAAAPDPEAVAREICLRMLSRAPRTRAQLADGLRRKDVPEDVAEAVLGRFADVGLIDDALFARAWVSSRHLGRGLGRRALAYELRGRGVAEDLIEDAVGELDRDEEYATAVRLAARRLAASRTLPRDVRLRRTAAVLARKGYSHGLAARALREALAADGETGDDGDVEAVLGDEEEV